MAPEAGRQALTLTVLEVQCQNCTVRETVTLETVLLREGKSFH